MGLYFITITSMKCVLVLCLLVAVSQAAVPLQSRDASAYGLGDFFDKVNRYWDATVKIAEQLKKLSACLVEVVEEIQKIIEEAKNKPQTYGWLSDKVKDVVNKNVIDKVIKKALDMVMDAVEGVIDMAIEKVNELTDGESLRQTIIDYIDRLLNGYVQTVVDTIRKVLDYLDGSAEAPELDDLNKLKEEILGQVRRVLEEFIERMKEKVRSKV